MTRRRSSGRFLGTVAPVIGVVLMITITGVLAAITGVFVLDEARDTNATAPQVTMYASVNSAQDRIVLEHIAGDPLEADRTDVRVTVAGQTITWDASSDGSASTVGSEIVIETAGTPSGIDWNDDGTVERTGSVSNGIDVESGDRVGIELVDTESETIVFRASLTA